MLVLLLRPRSRPGGRSPTIVAIHGAGGEPGAPSASDGSQRWALTCADRYRPSAGLLSAPSPARHVRSPPMDAVRADATTVPDVFAAGGPVGRDLAEVDWAATPLGPPERWPQSLASVVRIMLTSRFSMWMGWGPELT